jgi:hypothetical protein
MFEHEKIDIGYEDLVAETSNNGRRYTAPDGNKYPSVTTVLGILNEEAIAAWRNRVGEAEANRISGIASGRGTLVHEIIEDYLNNKDTSGYLPHIQQSLQNIKPILDKHITKVYGLEVPLYSKHLGLAGRCDCIGIYDGTPSIIDFKTSRRIKKAEGISNYFAQMSAYAIMWEERTGMPIVNTTIIMDVDNEEPLVFREKRDNHTKLLLNTIKEYNNRKLFNG